ncbi:Sperm associated antigen 1 [Balamuthia mandrillaris]
MEAEAASPCIDQVVAAAAAAESEEGDVTCIWEGFVPLVPDGQVAKKTLREGKGGLPSAGSKMTVHYEGYLLKEDGTRGEKFDSSRDKDFSNHEFTFTLGEEEVILGWEECMKTMRQGEVAILRCMHTWGYGSLGCPPRIPPKANLEFEIELLRFMRPQETSVKQADKPWPLKMEVAITEKETGNRHFIRKAFRQAVRAYNKALAEFSGVELEDIDAEQANQLQTLRLQLWNNMAAATLELNEFSTSLRYSHMVLEIEPKNVKALLRKAKAHSLRHDYEDAYQTLQNVAKLEPSNQQVRRLFEETRNRQKQAEAKQRQTWNGFLS